jgi:hypothetical protein
MQGFGEYVNFGLCPGCGMARGQAEGDWVKLFNEP